MAERSGPGMLREVGLSLFAVAGLVAGLSCGGGDVQAPTTGSIEITTATSGPEPDADGYAVSIDDQAEAPIGTNATLERGGLPSGSHSVRLAGMAANCTVAGENPRDISVPADETTVVTFQITCIATTGSLEITSSTTGASSDPDGYTLSLDGNDRGALATNGSVTVDGLTPGNHAAGLGGVAANCQVQGDNPRAVTVAAGASVTAAFAVVCNAPPAVTGNIRITVSTAGPEPDINGYAIALDAGSGQPIGVNATTTLANVGAGAHAVQLSGVAANCSIQGGNARSVTVSAGATADVSFAVTCGASTGTIEVTTSTAGGSPDPDGYTVAVDEGAAQSIGSNATLSVPAVSPGSHGVTLGGLAANCRVEGTNPHSVVVTAGATVTAAFNISCSASSTSKIAFFRSDNRGVDGIYVMHDDGSALQNVFQASEGSHSGAPEWAPDGSKILFLKTGNPFLGDNTDIYAVAPDGSNLANLTNTPDVAREIAINEGRGPVWSPDGRRIAFEKYHGSDDHGRAIYIMGSDGTSQTRLTFGSIVAFEPSWSPDGTKLVYTVVFAVADQYAIELSNADGTGVTRLTHFGVDTLVSDPLWSPDGGKISFSMSIFVGNNDVDHELFREELWVINPDGSGPMKVADDGADNPSEFSLHSRAAWSPDGTKIVVAMGGRSRGGQRIQVMNRDGTGLIRLGVHGLEPAWSPDGARLAFTDSDAEDIFVVHTDGTGLRNLTNSPGVSERHPAWSP